MKNLILLISLLFPVIINAQVKFDDYFLDKTLRFDFMLAGNSEKTIAYPMGMKEEPNWGGSLNNLVDIFNYGNLRYEVYDAVGGELIYSRGYGSLFQEWQTTGEAKIIERSFYEVVKFPFPKSAVRVIIKKFEKDGSYNTIYETVIDPGDFFIIRENVMDVQSVKIVDSGDPHKCVDIAFLAEGYTSEEMEKFRNDVKRLSDILFSCEPYSDYKKRINIWAVEAVSEESGTDIPGEGIYKNTVLNSSFYTFGLARYLTTFDIKSVNDYAGLVPHDNIVVLINSDRYGGGGMYNYYSGTTSDHPLTSKVFIHEFGHGFAGLADEYWSSDVAYEEFYPLNIEPWEANITTLVDFDSKWKDMIPEGVPVPTPSTDEYSKTIGLFEGGGYSAKGIYRSQIDCRMKSNDADGFCKVCQKTIREMIEFYIR